jgi:L-alanine-DL-glutamate epimerase-like enolase superfamily enzyme
MSLKFRRYRIYEVVVPARRDILSAQMKGRIYSGSITWDQLPLHLIEAETDAGFVAVGESPRGTSRETVEATLRDLLGRDLSTCTPPTMWMADGDLPQSYPHWSWQMKPNLSYLLMESLWLDAAGKAAGMPAHQLLGGAVRDRVLTDFWANRPDAPTMLALIREALERGLHGIKMKSDSTGDTARALLEIAGDLPAGFRVTIDPMNSWRSLRESARWLEALAATDLEIQLEDPYPYLVTEDWRQARTYKPLTIVCHARSEHDFRIALDKELADAYNLAGGGAFNFQQLAHVAEFYSKDCWQGSALELGVAQHVRLHAASTARACVLASDLQSEWVREHTLINERMQYVDGYALVPKTPGIGVSFDHDAIQRYKSHEWTIA